MRSYYLLFQGAKSANIKIFKDFCNAEKTNKNKQKCVSYFVNIPYFTASKFAGIAILNLFAASGLKTLFLKRTISQ